MSNTDRKELIIMKSKRLFLELNDCEHNIEKLKKTVEYASIYEYRLQATSSYGYDKGQQVYDLIIDGEFIRVLLDYYIVKKESILAEIDKVIELVPEERTCERNVSELTIKVVDLDTIDAEKILDEISTRISKVTQI